MDNPERRFRELHNAAYDDLLRFVRRRAQPDDVDDIVNETYLTAWRRLDDVPDTPTDARAWLFGVARHCILNATRSANRRTALAVRIASVNSPIVQEYSDLDDSMDLIAAWKKLKPEHQEALALQAWEGLTSQQAAKVLGISAIAFRLRVRAARKKLEQPATQSSPQKLLPKASS